ncbi:DUF6152 family protein [Inhella sp.]|uniref:DUF6152 family protein n=1 Tax=Inhella sp. TaxID=1921806 RepID=UPI0035AFC01B
MKRRALLLALPSLPALAHHGWSSFDLTQPLFLAGTAADVRWTNPHVELNLVRDARAPLPGDLAQRPLPAQSAPVEGAALLAKARLPRRADASWAVELAPLTRMKAWSVPEIQNGQRLELLGFSFIDEAGSAILRAEYLWLDGRCFGLRSSPLG